MNGNMEILFKLFFPAIVLIAWALNQVLNKETVATPNRGQPLGPRPGGLPPAPRPLERKVANSPYGPGRSTSSSAPGRTSLDDEIIIIRAENVRPASNAPARPQARRTAGRAKSPQAAPARRPAEPPAPELLGGKIATSVAQTVSLAGRPLNDLGASSIVAASSPAGASLTMGQPINLNSANLLSTLKDPIRVREAFLLNELLQAPVAKRTRPRSRS